MKFLNVHAARLNVILPLSIFRQQYLQVPICARLKFANSYRCMQKKNLAEVLACQHFSSCFPSCASFLLLPPLLASLLRLVRFRVDSAWQFAPHSSTLSRGVSTHFLLFLSLYPLFPVLPHPILQCCSFADRMSLQLTLPSSLSEI